jgi:hypothetical protein
VRQTFIVALFFQALSAAEKTCSPAKATHNFAK